MNVVASCNLLKANRPVDVQKIVHSSSCAAYGTPSQIPITKGTPQCAINTHGFTN
jgi:UDP-glucose 4-epimerase